MLFSKKLIHYTFSKNEIIKFKISLLPFYLLYLNTTSKKTLFFGSNVTNYYNFVKPSCSFDIIYKLSFVIKTKHLFLLTIYIIYTKLWKLVNLFFFKFVSLIKNKKKITILRAPCNHKNSKEQFGVNTYSGKLIGTLPFLQNKFYHNYILSFFLNEENPALNTVTYLFKQNAKKYNK